MMNGKRISGRYKIIKLIGGGGMANVYLAHDMILDREVAIKTLRLDFANEEEFIKRFQREAQSATSLTHPNIVSIYDVGEEDDLSYIVMEYVHGMTLKQYIQQHSPVDVEKAIDIMKQLTKAIAHAHQNHIIHRDIKPHNILLDEEGNVKITDFGIAMALSATSITQTNSVLGSVHYLSPEQARGGMATKKSDIYSLGIVMFELLTGRLPFSGESAVSIALKHLQSETPSMKRWAPHIPQSVENIVLKATAKDPFRRYENLDELQEELTTCLEPGRLDEPRFSVPLDDEATKAIPVITDQNAHSNLDDTIVHHHSTPEEMDTKPSAPVVEAKKGKKDKQKKKKSKDKNKKKWPILIVSLFFLLVLLGAAAVYFIPDLLGPKEIEVPDVSGKESAEAASLIVSQGFVVGKTEKQPSETVPEGEVIKTNPKGGRTAKEGSTIDLYVSSGKEKIEMKDYTDAMYDEVKKDLEELGFEVEKEEVNDQAEEGTILRQDPSEGEEVIPDETTVTLTVSLGPVSFDLRDLTGFDSKLLEEYEDLRGISIEKGAEAYSDNIPEGSVVSQETKAGTPIFEGDVIYVTISKGPDPTQQKEEEEAAASKTTKEVPLELSIPYEKEDGTPQSVDIYIEDANKKLDDSDQLLAITEETSVTLTFTLEEGQEGKYRILLDGKEYKEDTVEYPND
ncbi:Stk1 family PASTA domain-containing Ser/Thr kinase [Rossellomorea marisflavi]|uniref:Stk1 family PASTA domain-containing Ser/Thr kinase n=1 Tax=Rossellomorea marisflavi TaxID=189381 RepID=UPI00279DCC87|nr:Stk1 family PASTA domain-containing Ser/Thr kinase [Rossellomorea marisflavi]UTE71136.1 Stk1 family PASTA domain-containing Ser/Thr kinase [Rossellomorea marisflavi]